MFKIRLHKPNLNSSLWCTECHNIMHKPLPYASAGGRKRVRKYLSPNMQRQAFRCHAILQPSAQSSLLAFWYDWVHGSQWMLGPVCQVNVCVQPRKEAFQTARSKLAADVKKSGHSQGMDPAAMFTAGNEAGPGGAPKAAGLARPPNSKRGVFTSSMQTPPECLPALCEIDYPLCVMSASSSSLTRQLEGCFAYTCHPGAVNGHGAELLQHQQVMAHWPALPGSPPRKDLQAPSGCLPGKQITAA